MNNDIQIFNSEEFGDIRTVTIENEPWFVGKDVAVSLGYKDTSDALKKHVADEDKLTRCFADSGQNRQMYIINESGLYALIFGSKLESAKRFKHWVTADVLPTIRKTGGYQMAQPQGKELLALAVLEAQKTIEQQSKEIDRMRPKEIFADAVSSSHTSILIGELAKILRQNGIQTGQRRLFAWLRENGYLVKSGSSRNMPTQRSVERGLFEIKVGMYVDGSGANVPTKTAKVTGKGQQYFINKFLDYKGELV